MLDGAELVVSEDTDDLRIICANMVDMLNALYQDLNGYLKYSDSFEDIQDAEDLQWHYEELVDEMARLVEPHGYQFGIVNGEDTYILFPAEV